VWPVLLKIGPITIYSYGFMLALGFLTSIWLARRNISPDSTIDREKIIDLGLFVLVAGVIGARLTYVLLNISEYISSPLEIIMIHHGGLVFYGGLIGAVLTGWLLLKKWKWDFLSTADLIVPYLALAQAFGRIGCLLNGCCYGIGQHPAQVYSSLSLLGIFIILRMMNSRVKKKGAITCSYFILYPVTRFTIEFFRGDVPRVLGNLTVSQIISILVLGVTVVLLKRRKV